MSYHSYMLPICCICSQMISPRTRRKIALLPPPTEDDMGKIEAVEKDARAEQVGHWWPDVGVVIGCRLLEWSFVAGCWSLLLMTQMVEVAGCWTIHECREGRPVRAPRKDSSSLRV